MSKIAKTLIPISLPIVGVIILMVFLSLNDIAVLQPMGIIASQQRDLLILATLLMLVIVIPVFVLTFFIAWKYRADNPKAKYTPEWDHNLKLESLWWGFPCAIILVLAVVAWNSSHDLDPYRPISSSVSSEKPLRVQVVALQWKWLFIYPDQQIASVNELRLPTNAPVSFEITADAPMNSFWIPQLGGQVYAMAGMTTRLHLMADKPGTFYGSSANLSGEGFSAMHFETKATSKADFEQWILSTKTSSAMLDQQAYQVLAKPDVLKTSLVYSSVDQDLYDTVVMKYMGHAPAASDSSNHHTSGSPSPGSSNSTNQVETKYE